MDSIIEYLQMKVACSLQEKKTMPMTTKDYDNSRAINISTSLTSVILNIAFPNLNVWLIHILSSLCQKPNHMSSLYAILYVVNVVSHTARYSMRRNWSG